MINTAIHIELNMHTNINLSSSENLFIELITDGYKPDMIATWTKRLKIDKQYKEEIVSTLAIAVARIIMSLGCPPVCPNVCTAGHLSVPFVRT